MCRNIFVISQAQSPSPAPEAKPEPQPEPKPQSTPKSPTSRHVGDVLELIPAEPDDVPYFEVSPTQPPARGRGPAWQEAHPAERGPVVPDAETQRPKKTTPLGSKKVANPEPAPRVLSAGKWDAPPVRRKESEPTSQPRGEVDELPQLERIQDTAKSNSEIDSHPPRNDDRNSSPSLAEFEARPNRRRWFSGVIIGGSLFTLVLLVIGVVAIWVVFRQSEEKLAKQADEFYANGQFGAAVGRYEGLTKNFPNSENRPRYELRLSLSKVRQTLDSPPEDISELLTGFADFLDQFDKSPLLVEHYADVSGSLAKLLGEFATKAVDNAASAELSQSETALQTVDGAMPLVERVEKIKKLKPSEMIAGKIAEVRQKLQVAYEQKKRLETRVAQLVEIAGKPSYSAMLALDKALGEAEAEFKDIRSDPRVQPLRAKIEAGHLGALTIETGPPTILVPPPAEITYPSIVLDPLISPEIAASRRDETIALALSRGVLYGASPSTGKIRWTRRLGIDTTALPVRVPARAGVPELILALNSDTKTLTALDIDGNALWKYQFDSPVLGRPVVVDQRAYLASYHGEVHEIELANGTALCRYNLGQRLILGGTHEPNSSRIYFPGDDGCIYVLNVAKKKCESILYSRHPAGSLRGELIVIASPSPGMPGWLILEQASGLDAMKLRVFEISNSDAGKDSTVSFAEREPKPTASLRGWTWFAPYHDPEKLVMLSDAGILGVFGIRQPNTNDPELFSQLGRQGVDLRAYLFPQKRDAENLRPGRSEVVQVQGDEVWVAASGQLQRLRLAWQAQSGPKLQAAWSNPLEIGSPLHATQVIDTLGTATSRESGLGRSGLICTTQPKGSSTTHLSRIDDETGKLLWRRQLGFVCQMAPVPIAMDKGQPLFLAIDQSGALMSLDPQRYIPQPGAQWLLDAKQQLLANGLTENPAHPPEFLPTSDGRGVYVLIFPSDREMVVRQVTAAATQRSLVLREEKVPMSSPIAGRAALVGQQLVLPLANGALARVKLPLRANAEVESSLEWLGVRSDAQARSLLVGMSDSQFLASDGGLGIASWSWQAKNPDTERQPKGNEGNVLELEDRILGLAKLSDVLGAPSRVALTDSGGKLTLAEYKTASGELTAKRSWRVGGPITAGPFPLRTPQGERIACIIGRTKLAWIDPNKDEIWTHTAEKEPDLVGEPQMVGGLVALTYQTGLVMLVDPTTKTVVGKPFQLQGSIAPAAAARAFDAERLLLPASDGTLLLLPLGKKE
jgi:hypothetical protein